MNIFGTFSANCPKAITSSGVAAGGHDAPVMATSNDERMAREMVTTAGHLGEHLEYHAVTPGDGNCFYHALLDQIQNRPEVSELIAPGVAQSEHLHDHFKLRQGMVNFVRETVDPLILGQSEVEFHDFLQKQACPATFAEDAVIQSAAIFLGVDIWLISAQNTAVSRYTKIGSGRQPAQAHIILGYIPGIHFQSLYPALVRVDDQG